jgi:hypothetical protein
MLRHLALMIGTALVLWLQLVLPIDMTGRHTDLASFQAAGRAAAVGANPYAITPELWVVELPHFGIHAPTVNLNMPVSVLWMEASASVELGTLFRASLLLNMVLYGIALMLLSGGLARLFSWRVAWAVCLTGFWQTLALGQIYILMLPLVIGAWLAVRDRNFVRAGVLLGVLIGIKPQFAIWPVLLACTGLWQTLPPALLTAAVISVLPVLRYGPIIYRQWLDSLSIVDRLVPIPGNGSVVALFARLNLASIGTLLATGLLAALVWWCWRRRPDRSWPSPAPCGRSRRPRPGGASASSSAPAAPPDPQGWPADPG